MIIRRLHFNWNDLGSFSYKDTRVADPQIAIHIIAAVHDIYVFTLMFIILYKALPISSSARFTLNSNDCEKTNRFEDGCATH